MDRVFAAAGERSILVITHRAAEAARCESVVTLEAGRVVSPLS
jgi:ABC-type transport system involved in cytochrome bd biosynthesis fused ATPase/permease subunit